MAKYLIEIMTEIMSLIQTDRDVLLYLLKTGGGKTAYDIRAHLLEKNKNRLTKLAEKDEFAEQISISSLVPSYNTLRGNLKKMKERGFIIETGKKDKFKHKKYSLSPDFLSAWITQRKDLIETKSKKQLFAYPKQYRDFFELEDLLENKEVRAGKQ